MTQIGQMDALVARIGAAFSFPRPNCLVIHPGDGCFDCPEVADILEGTDCTTVMLSDDRFFSTFPMDCMSADALLHYLPAIVRESFTPDGISVAETIAWILGADEWETDLTISEQIKPKLSSEQLRLIRELLDAYSKLKLSDHAADQLADAIRWWAN